MSNSSEQPQLISHKQYIKDLSFETPLIPGSYELQSEPKLNVSLNVTAGKLNDTLYESILHVNVESTHEENVTLHLELSYSGVFSLINIPEDQVESTLLVSCPRMLFPFARRIVHDLTSESLGAGLLLNPVDFMALYIQQKEQQSAIVN